MSAFSYDAEKKGVTIKMDQVPPGLCSMVDLEGGWENVQKLSICFDPETNELSVKAIVAQQ